MWPNKLSCEQVTGLVATVLVDHPGFSLHLFNKIETELKHLFNILPLPHLDKTNSNIKPQQEKIIWVK